MKRNKHKLFLLPNLFATTPLMPTEPMPGSREAREWAAVDTQSRQEVVWPELHRAVRAQRRDRLHRY